MMGARGRFVVLLGPDGCGKSAVVGELMDALAPEFAGVEARHYHPRDVWGTGTPVVRPHAAHPRGRIASALKLAYDVARFRRGHRRSVRPKVDAGEVVLFDRYFHDVLADPGRYRYGGPAWLARLAARLAPAPDLFVVLDAPPAVLQARKHEVSAAESGEARRAYLALARALPRARVVDCARPLPQVAADVAALVRAA
jgi:thymidylate kinase